MFCTPGTDVRLTDGDTLWLPCSLKTLSSIALLRLHFQGGRGAGESAKLMVPWPDV